MSETSGGTYPRRDIPWTLTLYGSAPLLEQSTFLPAPLLWQIVDGDPDTPAHYCALPDADLTDAWEWTCPDCGTVHERHTRSWWEPREEMEQ